MDKNTKRPVCLTFGSPLLGDDGLHKIISGRPSWISCFVHVVSKQDQFPGLFISSHNTIVSSEPSSEPSRRYKPFGLYLFCSETGVACFSEPEFVLELLRALNSKNMQLTDYGLVLEGLKDKAIVKDRHVGEWNNNPLRTGIILKLQAI
ncbi:hypothetical protein AG4045_016314 [Apium graveolens]|uniref:Uncharacterized protein n=1 Tax=Apium graveolens TaxID=4045 RepID=A0A6L5BAD5_APIGR|nr:hypothetical protein AG4045_016314 [Apium graveolens]